MKAVNIITNEITPLKTSDSGDFALRQMEELKVLHLPIVNNEDFLGLISEEDILNQEDTAQSIGTYSLSLSRAAIFDSQHFYDVIKIIDEEKITLLPVVDSKNQYLGAISLQTVCHQLGKITAVSNPGAVIVLEIFVHDYLMSQIAQIVESNDAKIMSMYVSNHADSTKMDVILKINKNDITSIIATFNRYNYIIKETFSESDYYEMLNSRYDEFISWLNV